MLNDVKKSIFINMMQITGTGTKFRTLCLQVILRPAEAFFVLAPLHIQFILSDNKMELGGCRDQNDNILETKTRVKG